MTQNNQIQLIGIILVFVGAVLAAFIPTCSSPNKPPTAKIICIQTEGKVPFTVRCNGVKSSDSDGEIKKHSWSIDDKVVSDKPFFTKTFDQANYYNVILKVEDDRGLSGDDIAIIRVLPGPTITPTPTPRPTKLPPTITPTPPPEPVVRLRSSPATLSDEDVKNMLKKHNFFDNNRNKSGDFKNDFKDNGNGTVTDRKTGLMWQQSGPDNYMNYEDAVDYVRQLNRKDLGGYNDWRLPTLEELASLLERQDVNGLYIDPVFAKKQSWCWSSDKHAPAGAWNVDFRHGTACGKVRWVSLGNFIYVRAVRVRQ
ncbi:DUF1566 domain-containing protein [Desulfococcaceae bacterium HSG9]|nr:DUF1566 domain-containing protein [Desulfococcaceae bacterium HSG9]